MVAQVHGVTLVGIDALPVVVEVDLQGGSPDFIMVGLPDKAVQESRDRVRTAIRNSGFEIPPRKVVCNLAPGDLRKEGPLLDLAIAVALLAAHGIVPNRELKRTLVLGELGLDGLLRPVDGATSAALLAREQAFTRLIVPTANAAEAAVVPEVEVYGVDNLLDAVELLNGSLAVYPFVHSRLGGSEPEYEVDFGDVKGQTAAIRALEIAAAGGHNVLMVGPPGSGKTMLAKRVPTILPPMDLDEAIEVTRIHSAAGQHRGRQGLLWERPFRSPHHTSSYAAVVGGGKVPRPGEITLAHHGVLFLDELPEFDRGVLEALRQPLEDGEVTVSRVQQSMTFPARNIVVAAMNPCPCGYKGYPEAKCVGAAVCERYSGKVSGPLIDRIDLHLVVPRLVPEELVAKPTGEPSRAIRARVIAARQRQQARAVRKLNATLSSRELRDLVQLDAEGETFLARAASKLNFSARVYDRILRVGRTIADLAGSDRVEPSHLAEAVQYRHRAGLGH